MDADYDTTPFDERADAAAAKAAFQTSLRTLSAAGGIPASSIGRSSLDAPEVFASTPLLIVSDTYEAALVSLLWLRYWHPRVLAPLALVPASVPAPSAATVSALASCVAAAQKAALEADRVEAQARADAAADSNPSVGEDAAPGAVSVFSKHQNREVASVSLAAALLSACVHTSLPTREAAAAAAAAAAEAGAAPAGAAAAWAAPSKALLRLRADGSSAEAEALATAALDAGKEGPAAGGMLLPVVFTLPVAAEAWEASTRAVEGVQVADKSKGGQGVLVEMQEGEAGKADAGVCGVGRLWSIIEELPDLLASF